MKRNNFLAFIKVFSVYLITIITFSFNFCSMSIFSVCLFDSFIRIDSTQISQNEELLDNQSEQYVKITDQLKNKIKILENNSKRMSSQITELQNNLNLYQNNVSMQEDTFISEMQNEGIFIPEIPEL